MATDGGEEDPCGGGAAPEATRVEGGVKRLMMLPYKGSTRIQMMGMQVGFMAAV